MSDRVLITGAAAAARETLANMKQDDAFLLAVGSRDGAVALVSRDVTEDMAVRFIRALIREAELPYVLKREAAE